MMAAATPFFNKIRVKIFRQAFPRHEWDQNSPIASWKSRFSPKKLPGPPRNANHHDFAMFVFWDFGTWVQFCKSTRLAKSQLADSSGEGVSECLVAWTDGDVELLQNHAEHAERQCLSPCPRQWVAYLPTNQLSCRRGCQAPPAAPKRKRSPWVHFPCLREEDDFGKQQFCETSQKSGDHWRCLLTLLVFVSSLSRCPGLLST